jgi:hypothetical protein
VTPAPFNPCSTERREASASRFRIGSPTDPAFFAIAVWLPAPDNATRYRDAGINTYVAHWKGPSAEPLDALKAAGMKVVCHQNELGLQRKDDPTIIGWMHGDEPDNAQPKHGGG